MVVEASVDKKLSVLLATGSAGGTIAAVRNLGANGVKVSVVASQPLSAAKWSRWTSNFYRVPSETESHHVYQAAAGDRGE